MLKLGFNKESPEKAVHPVDMGQAPEKSLGVDLIV